MLVVALLLVLRVDEGIQVAELEFHGRLELVAFRYLADRLDYLLAVLNRALMIVGHLENKEIVEVEFLVERRGHRMFKNIPIIAIFSGSDNAISWLKTMIYWL